MRRIWTAGLALPAAGLIALAVVASPSQAEEQRCARADESTEVVMSGVTLTYDSSFRCADAADAGEYAITVSVTNDGDSNESVRVDRLELSHTTPRPGGGGGPEATAIADGLPVMVAAGETAPFDVRGTYELVSTDEGDKATLHLRAFGTGPFSIGINVHLRAEGTTEGGMTPALPRPGHHGCHGFRRGVAPGPGVGG